MRNQDSNEGELVNLEIRCERAHERYLYQSCTYFLPPQAPPPKERPGTNCACVKKSWLFLQTIYCLIRL